MWSEPVRLSTAPMTLICGDRRNCPRRSHSAYPSFSTIAGTRRRSRCPPAARRRYRTGRGKSASCCHADRRESGMARTAEQPLARLEHGTTRRGAVENLRREERVAGRDPHLARRRELRGELGAPAPPSQADIEVLRQERIEADRARRDDVAEPVVEPGDARPSRDRSESAARPRPRTIASVPASRSGLPSERRRAERLQDRRFLDAEAGRCLHLRISHRRRIVCARSTQPRRAAPSRRRSCRCASMRTPTVMNTRGHSRLVLERVRRRCSGWPWSPFRRSDREGSHARRPSRWRP